MISEYADPQSAKAKTNREINTLQAEFELQQAKEQLARLKQEIEINQIKEEEQRKLKAKVREQRK